MRCYAPSDQKGSSVCLRLTLTPAIWSPSAEQGQNLVRSRLFAPLPLLPSDFPRRNKDNAWCKPFFPSLSTRCLLSPSSMLDPRDPCRFLSPASFKGQSVRLSFARTALP